MAENDAGGSMPEKQLCKRTDGRRWRCRRPVVEKGFCHYHLLQNRCRQKRDPVPDSLKLDRLKRANKLPEIEAELANSDVGVSISPPKSPKRGKRKVTEASIDVYEEKPSGVHRINPHSHVGSSSLASKRGKKEFDEEQFVESSEEIVEAALNRSERDLMTGRLRIDAEKELEKPLVKELKYGRLEIPQALPSSRRSNSAKRAGSPIVKIGDSGSNSVPIRLIRSKNVEPLPMVTVKHLPVVQANVKASAKKKKKCHWCHWTGYRVFVKCQTCKKHFFCEDCINERYHDKAAVKRECPVCLGTCRCRACVRAKPKEVKTKEPVVDDRELVVYDTEPVIPNREVVVYNREKKFDKIKQLHLIRVLLPVMEQINQEKIFELYTEAKNKGKTHDQIRVKLAVEPQDPKELKCRICDSWIVDVHRRCQFCSYILCVLCCQEVCEGYLHQGLEDLKNSRTVRSKSSSKISWNFGAFGSIRCPPKKLNGCGNDFLNLTSFSPFGFTKDLEASAKEIDLKYKFKKPFWGDSVSSLCSMCEENEEIGSEKVGNLNKNKDLYFSTKKDFQGKHLEHFMKHWGKGEPLIVRDVLERRFDLSWDPGFMFCKYLEKSAESREGKTVILKSSDWCNVTFGRKQIFSGGTAYANAREEFLKFNVRFPSGVFRDQFPYHYETVMQALPFQEYINPTTGLLNLAVNLLDETEDSNLGPFVYISYGESEDFMRDEFLTKLCYHAYDKVNLLANATERPIPERKLNEAKILMSKYNSQEHMESSSKINASNNLEKRIGYFENFSEYEIGSSSLEIIDTCGAQWDVFCRQDVPKLVEYLRKHLNDLKKPKGSPEKIVHPIFDEIFYLESLDKKKLKEEFDVEPWSFEQKIGEAVFIPAGCPYQMKKTKSCVNVVLEFVSPESVSECVKLTDELHQLPVNHKAKGKISKVKKMAIKGMHAAIEEIRKVSQPEFEGTIKE